jgi:hypothetical protein
MIKEFVDKFMSKKHELEAFFTEKHPSDYKELVTEVIKLLHEEDYRDSPDPNRITEIDDGDYQGTLVYVIAATGYQPTDYWYVKVYYGSCSGCDTLERIREYDTDKPSSKQTADYMSLALHIIQNLKAMENLFDEDED